MYFQVQFIKVQCTATPRNAIKYELKKERLPARWEKYLLVRQRKYHDNPEKKKQAFKKRYHDKSKSIRQYCKEKYLINRISKISYQKAKYQENPEAQLAYKKCIYLEIAEIKKKKKSKKEVPIKS